jgi:hypothetical protein
MKYLIFFLVLVSSCGIDPDILDLNTVDLQVSKSIEDSKKKGVFIRKVNIIFKDKACTVENAWIENTWLNDINALHRAIKKLPHESLVIKLVYCDSLEKKFGDFNVSWYIIDKNENYFARKRGLYVLRGSDKDTFPSGSVFQVVKNNHEEISSFKIE